MSDTKLINKAIAICLRASQTTHCEDRREGFKAACRELNRARASGGNERRNHLIGAATILENI